MNILIIKFRNIGDVLLVSPLINNLKHYYRSAKIDVVINQGTEAVLSENPNVDKLIIYERNKINVLSKIRRLTQELKFFFSFYQKPYDLVINLTEGDRGAFITKLTRSNMRIGYRNKNVILKNVFTHHLPRQDYRHTLETNLDPLRLLNIPIKNKRVEIFCTQQDFDFIDKRMSGIGQFIHIHPVSRWLFKSIADETMANIIDFCDLELKHKVVITAAPIEAEIKKVNEILSLCQSNPVNLSGKLSLKQTAALNQKAKAFVGVDTAIMHVSAANNVPVLAFFGPSGSDHWGPWDNDLMQSNYTRRNGIQYMGKHRVIAESRDCQPCGRDGCNGSKVSDCLMSLDIDIIKQNIQEMLVEQSN